MSKEKIERAYQICAKTIMDTSDPNIVFDDLGISNHYYSYHEEEKRYVIKGEEGILKLEQTAEIIRSSGKGKPYDCILGLSGGVDSTYLCLLAKRLGLRPLVVHFDNGWNSELAVYNIENTIKKLGFDLFTYVVNWPEFRDLQRSFFKANVIDLEVLTDHAFMAVLHEQAYKRNINFILGGMNVVTESILPRDWIGDKGDSESILNIQKMFGTYSISELTTFPMLSPIRRKFLERVSKLKVITPLNWIEYNYDKIKSEIKTELGWRDYGGKHYESIFTRFYQGYILPNKFNVDKRRAHLSTLICSGQITRAKALEIINSPAYDHEQYVVDREFVLKKLGFSESEFTDYIQKPRIPHNVYGNSPSLYEKYPFLRILRPVVNFVYPEK